MCGFFLSKNIDLDKNQINEIKGLIRHRGPDYSDHMQYNNITLIHTRLSIQDISKNGHQPMVDSSKEITIVFNGEIYNHLNLRKKYLDKFNISFRSKTDTETLLYLYKYYNCNFLSWLKGIFSFCIYDSRDGSIFVVRDQFGIKPLYYFEYSDKFIFCSEIKPIILIAKKFIKFNYKEISKFLSFLYLPNNEKTSFEGIKKIQSGNALILNASNKKKFIEYFSLMDLPLNINKNIDYYDIDKSLNEAILSQTLSDVPLSIFLSGGLDSSTILYYLNKNNFNNLHAFTIKNIQDKNITEGNENDYQYALIAADYFNSNIHSVEPKINFINDLDKLMLILEEPISDPAPFNLLSLSKNANELGFKVAFSGAGGDEIFAGYRRHLFSHYAYLMSFFPKILYQNFLKIFNANFQSYHFIRRLCKSISSHLMGKDKDLIANLHWINADYLSEILLPELREAFNSDILFEDMLPTIKSLNSNNLNSSLILDLKYFMTEHNLLYNDKIGMSQGIEIRVPFLDLDLVKNLFSISSKYKIKNFSSKYILKRLMKNKLPNSILNRSKTGFNFPIRSIIKNKFFFNEIIKPRLIDNDIFDYKGIEKLFNLNYQNKVDASYTLYSTICISSWYNQFKLKI